MQYVTHVKGFQTLGDGAWTRPKCIKVPFIGLYSLNATIIQVEDYDTDWNKGWSAYHSQLELWKFTVRPEATSPQYNWSDSGIAELIAFDYFFKNADSPWLSLKLAEEVLLTANQFLVFFFWHTSQSQKGSINGFRIHNGYATIRYIG